MKKPPMLVVLSWLGWKYVNQTFSDEDQLDEIDIQELENIINNTED